MSSKVETPMTPWLLNIGDAGSATAAVTAWVALINGLVAPFLAALASVLTIAWMAIRVYESKTFQCWLCKRRARKQGIACDCPSCNSLKNGSSEK